jgi:hypothetical protein
MDMNPKASFGNGFESSLRGYQTPPLRGIVPNSFLAIG